MVGFVFFAVAVGERLCFGYKRLFNATPPNEILQFFVVITADFTAFSFVQVAKKKTVFVRCAENDREGLQSREKYGILCIQRRSRE